MMLSDLGPQGRAAVVTMNLLQRGELTTQEICDLTGLTGVGARFLMDNLSRAGVPYFKPQPGVWRIIRADDFETDER